MKELKRILSFVLCLVMVLGLFPAGILTASAADGSTSTGTMEIEVSTDKTYYVLANAIEAGKQYLIVNANAAADPAYAVANNSGTVAAAQVQVIEDDLNGDGINETYIDLADAANALWTSGSSITDSGTTTLYNGGAYLYKNSEVSFNVRVMEEPCDWTYELSTGQMSSGLYLRCRNGWSMSSSFTPVYFYQPMNVAVTTRTTVSGTYAITGTASKTSVTAAAGETIALGASLTFTPDDGGSYVEDVTDGAAYTVIEGADALTIDGSTATLTGAAGDVVIEVRYQNGSMDNEVVDYIAITVNGGSGSVPTEPEETVPVEGEKTVTIEVGTQVDKVIYVPADSLTAGESYLIVNGDKNTALGNSGGTDAPIAVTVKNEPVTVGSATYTEYIEDPDARTVWAASDGIVLENDGQSLYARSSTDMISGSSGSNWSYDAATGYLTGTNGSNTTVWYIAWTGSEWVYYTAAKNASLLLYRQIEIEDHITSRVTYSMRAEDLEQVVSDTVRTGTIGFCVQGNGTDLTELPEGGSYAFKVLADESGIIDSISEDGTLNFTGEAGTAQVRVSFTWTVDGIRYTVYEDITVHASEPYYTLDLHLHEGGVVGEEITMPVAIKGVEPGDTYSIWAVIRCFDGTDPEGVDLGDVEDSMIEWSASDPAIASVDPETGIITFSGEDGTVQITATYQDGNRPSDTITISATKFQYMVPGDGTSDFPEYPNEGAIRLDKTGTAVGNFSETGIAQIELSMSGVPYTTGSEIDVVLMLDRSTSMETGNRVAATVAATKAFIEGIVKNEDGTYNDNRIYIGYFMGKKTGTEATYDITDADNIGGIFTTVDNDAEFDALMAAIDKEYTVQTTVSGTDWQSGLEKCEELLKTAKTDGIGNNRRQFCVFMSDGAPDDYRDLDNNSRNLYTVDWITDGSRNSSYKNELYTTRMKRGQGVTVYTVLLGQGAEQEEAEFLMNDLSGPAGESVNDTGSDMTKLDRYYFSVADQNAGAEMEEVFQRIATAIMQAATDVIVEDQITDFYTMIFDLPEGTKDIDGITNDFYIEFVKYTLDAVNHERTDVVESVTKLYLKNTGDVLSAASDGSGTDCAAPVFAARTLGDRSTKLYWTTNAGLADGAALSYDDGTDTYYFIPAGCEINDDGTVPAGWYNMISGAYAHGNVDPATNMSEDLVIATPWFVYNASTRMIYWTLDKLQDATTEYALRYFLYLDQSATEVGTENETDPGSYLTNDHAYLTYTNFQGEECRLEFPKPQFTWSGAQVSYVFYLVNAAGQPINKSGQVVDFANATFVTDVYTENTVWNKGEDGKITADSQLNIDWLAANLLPDDYMVYDLAANYQLHVYGDHTGSSIFDYFTIAGGTAEEISESLNSRLNLDTTTASVETTKVYNTKAGKKVDDYGTYTSKPTGSLKDETVLSGFDFYNTTVAFAVVWQPALVPDTVVVDYGLDVLINVTHNDLLQNIISGIGLDAGAYGNTAMNTGVTTVSRLGRATLTTEGNNTISIENENQIRFHQGDMAFDEAVTFYYESPVEFWEHSEQKNGYMYSSVTVIPATSIYYEDDFVTYNSYTWSGDEQGWVLSEDNLWGKVVEGAPAGTQDQDRPGESQLSGVIDADNIYGHDSAYASMSKYSNGSVMKATVDYDNYAEASFSFWGTGFDIVSLTSSNTGTILVDVKDAETGDVAGNFVVDTYYGYDLVEYRMYTYTWCKDAEDPKDPGHWEIDEGVVIDEAAYAAGRDESRPAEPKPGETYVVYKAVFQIAPNNPDALYQIPVMKVEDLDYGHYNVTVRATYDPIFDHSEPGSSNGSYDFYLDAIRIYDPANLQKDDGTIAGAYEADHEAYPRYFELRNAILSANTFENLDPEDVVGGLVYIDGSSEAVISDYLKYGPNNELYLSSGQAVSFAFDEAAIRNALDWEDGGSAPAGYEIDRVHIGLKLVSGTAATAELYDIKGTADSAAVDTTIRQTLNTATDMYYDITELLDGDAVVIRNSEGGILSVTDIKVTYRRAEGTGRTAESVSDEGSIFLVSRDIARMALASLEPEAAPGMPGMPEPPVEPEVFTPGVLSVKLQKTNVRAGDKLTVTVNTSCDVSCITVNGRKVTDYTEQNGSIIRTWVVVVTAEGEGPMQIEVIAYNSAEEASAAVSSTVEVRAPKGSFGRIR